MCITRKIKTSLHFGVDRSNKPLENGTPDQYGKKGITLQMIIKFINKCFENAIITTDVGQNQLWTTQFLDIDENKQMLSSGSLGTMGYGFPAAIRAKLGIPIKM